MTRLLAELIVEWLAVASYAGTFLLAYHLGHWPGAAAYAFGCVVYTLIAISR